MEPISTCVSWDNNRQGVCVDVNGAIPGETTPGTPSKCRCESIAVPDVVIRKIVVDKVTDPAGAGKSFPFTLTKPGGSIVGFSLTDSAAPWISGLLPAATGYSVVETVPEGWVQTAVHCTNGLAADNIDPGNIDLTPNREVRCTFYNAAGSLAADLVEYAGEAQGSQVALRWETVSDFSVRGFNVYRGLSNQGPWARVNSVLIPAQSPGAASGARYEWVDRSPGSGASLVPAGRIGSERRDRALRSAGGGAGRAQRGRDERVRARRERFRDGCPSRVCRWGLHC